MVDAFSCVESDEFLSQFKANERQRRVYPDEIQDWLTLSDKEGAQFIHELAKENLCYIKYDFTCSCGNECTFYQRKGPISPYECSECGQKYDNNVIPSKGTMTLELKSKKVKFHTASC